MKHIAEMDRSILRRDPEMLRQDMSWPPDSDPSRQLAFALGRLGPPPYSLAVKQFLNRIYSKTTIEGPAQES